MGLAKLPSYTNMNTGFKKIKRLIQGHITKECYNPYVNVYF